MLAIGSQHKKMGGETAVAAGDETMIMIMMRLLCARHPADSTPELPFLPLSPYS